MSEKKYTVTFHYDTIEEMLQGETSRWSIAELRDEIAALEFYNKDKDPSEQLDLIDFLMSNHTITWGCGDEIIMVTVDKRDKNKEVKP